MLLSNEIRKQIKAGATASQILLFIQTLEKCHAVKCDIVTPVTHLVTPVTQEQCDNSVIDTVTDRDEIRRQRDRARQQKRRDVLKNKENENNGRDKQRDESVTDRDNSVTSQNPPNGSPMVSLINPSLNPSLNPPRKKQTQKEIDYSPEFLTFWQAYPKNNGTKTQAFVRYQQAITKGVHHETIIRGAEKYAVYSHSEGTEQRYIKHACTWLHQRGWEVEYSAESDISCGNVKRSTNGHARPTMHDRIEAAGAKAIAELNAIYEGQEPVN